MSVRQDAGAPVGRDRAECHRCCSFVPPLRTTALPGESWLAPLGVHSMLEAVALTQQRGLA